MTLARRSKQHSRPYAPAPRFSPGTLPLPSGRTGSPQDVVDAVLYLADSRFVSGVILPVDGGNTAGTWH